MKTDSENIQLALKAVKEDSFINETMERIKNLIAITPMRVILKEGDLRFTLPEYDGDQSPLISSLMKEASNRRDAILKSFGVESMII